jgi:hypothetical protein
MARGGHAADRESPWTTLVLSPTSLAALPSNGNAKQEYCHRQFVGLNARWQESCSSVAQARPSWRKSIQEMTTMAQIDQQAARKELKEASELRAKAAQLVEIAGELEQEAQRHEGDAIDLTAPTTTPKPSTRSRR